MIIKIKIFDNKYLFNVNDEIELMRLLINSIRKQVDLKETDLKENSIIIQKNVENFIEVFNISKKLNSSQDIDVRVNYSDDGNIKYILAMSEEAKTSPLSVPYCVCSLKYK